MRGKLILIVCLLAGTTAVGAPVLKCEVREYMKEGGGNRSHSYTLSAELVQQPGKRYATAALKGVSQLVDGLNFGADGMIINADDTVTTVFVEEKKADAHASSMGPRQADVNYSHGGNTLWLRCKTEL